MTDPAIDEAALLALLEDMGGDREVVKELIQSFLEEGPRLVAAGREAVAAGDVPEVQRAFHTLKSTAATFGALPLSALSKEIEQAARSGTMPTPAQVAEAERRLAAARAELVKRLA
jgi:HPt (histidine-containing phosphotransfer) domain-containing protein